MRLIDADALAVKHASIAKTFAKSDAQKSLMGRVMYNTECAPTVNAVPVVHSQWKCTDAYPHWLYCLNCYKKFVPNVEWVKLYGIPTNYCPSCGAIMDEEAKA